MDSTLRAKLLANSRLDEVVSAIDHRGLAGGSWWDRRSQRQWPPELLAGVIEPRRGYRFRPENLASALMLDSVRADAVVDLGAGTGSLLLIAAYLLEPAQCVAVERQSSMVDRLGRSLRAHETISASVVEGDLRMDEVRGAVLEELGGPADLVLANPPYFPRDWGRPSARESTRLSTHAEFGEVDDFIEAAAELVGDSGRVLVVFDAGRLARLLLAAARYGLQPSRMLFIEDQRQERQGDPYRVWTELRRVEPGGCEIDWLGRCEVE